MIIDGSMLIVFKNCYYIHGFDEVEVAIKYNEVYHVNSLTNHL